MTKVSRMDFEFEFPDEDSDEVIVERTVELVMEELQDNHVVPEISTKETDPFIIGVTELAEKAKQNMIACAYNVQRSGHAKTLEGNAPKVFMAAYGHGMEEAWARGLSMNAQGEALYMAHFM
jgi:hypothetical protein